jgi:hypothetical protein
MTRRSIHSLECLLRKRQEFGKLEQTDAPRAAKLRALREWQSARLARTYEDLRRDPRYAAATDFFLTDLYGSRDFRGRDLQFRRAWLFFKRLLPAAALQALGDAIELDVLTVELDHAMTAWLPPAGIDAAAYGNAYRRVGRRDARTRQIDLVVAAGKDLQRAVRHSLSGALLKAARAPAHAAGLGLLQDFLERGFQAFRAMPNADHFLDTICARETALMEALFAGAES